MPLRITQGAVGPSTIFLGWRAVEVHCELITIDFQADRILLGRLDTVAPDLALVDAVGKS